MKFVSTWCGSKLLAHHSGLNHEKYYGQTKHLWFRAYWVKVELPLPPILT